MSLQYENIFPILNNGQFEGQQQQQLVNGELITYYPTWFNGEQQPLMKPTGVLFGEEQRIFGEDMLSQQQSVVISGVSGKYSELVVKKSVFGGLQDLLVGAGNDAQLKTLVNTVYETIVDAGLNPVELRGTRTGVFIGATSITSFGGMYEQQTVGPRQQLLAAQLAQVFEFKGPVQVLNTTQSTSMLALDAAVQAIKSGLIEQAIVAGVCLDKFVEEVKETKEIVAAAMFVQKKSSTRRYYAKVDSFVGKNINMAQQIEKEVLRQIYTESEIDPQITTYIPFQQQWYQWSKNQLPLNSSVPLYTKFNTRVGHEETTTGIFALVRMLVQIQRGVIPTTWEYLEPSKEVLSFLNGRFDITPSTKFFGGLLTLKSLANNGQSRVYIQLQPNREFTMRPQFFYTKQQQQIQQQQQQQQQLFNGAARIFSYTIDLSNTTEESYLYGHQIAGRVVYPTTGYLYLVWKSLAKIAGYEQVDEVPITFENVEFLRDTYITPETGVRKPLILQFSVQVVPGTGLFELYESGSLVATGRAIIEKTPLIEVVEQQQQQPIRVNVFNKSIENKIEMIEQEDIYNELKSRGYEFQGEFQPIIKATVDGTQGELAWTGKWIPFLGAMLQMNIYGGQQQQQLKGLYTPKYIKSIRIDPRIHLQQLNNYSLPNYINEQPINSEFSYEQIQKWKQLFSQYQMQQQQVIQKMLRSPIIGEPQMRLLAELERLVEEQKQQEIVYNRYETPLSYGKQSPITSEFIYNILQKQFANHRLQQSITSQLMKLHQKYYTVEQQKNGEILEILKEMILEQQQLHIEEKINDEERFQYMQELKFHLREKMLSLVQKLQLQQQGGDLSSTIELVAQLERELEAGKQYILIRQERQEQMTKTLTMIKKQAIQHVYLLQTLKQQVQPEHQFVKQLIEEVEKSLVETVRYYSEKEGKEQSVCEYVYKIFDRVSQIHTTTQQFVTYKRVPQWEELRALLVELESLVQTRFQKIISLEIRKQQEEQIVSVIQYKFERLYQQIDRVLSEKIYRSPLELEQQQGLYNCERSFSPRQYAQELQSIMQLKQKLFREFRIIKQQQQLEQFENKWRFTAGKPVAYPVIFNPLKQLIKSGGVEINGIRFGPVAIKSSTYWPIMNEYNMYNKQF